MRRCLQVGTVLLLLAGGFTAGAGEYPDDSELRQRLNAVASANPSLFRVRPLVSKPGTEVMLLGIGSQGSSRPVSLPRGGELPLRRPAMLAVAGIEGNDLFGTLTLLSWAEQIGRDYPTNAALQQLLESTTIYLVPRANPDGPMGYFDQPRRETDSNLRPFDDDHDGTADEDGPEDINSDGLITWMRVEDPDGDMIQDPVDARLMLPAERARGEVGRWKVYPEGIDNDKDERWNEDGPGGVNLNRNFPYGFRFFSGNSGPHPVSEATSRALADFVVEHPEIGLVFTYGAADNLVQTLKAEAPKRPPTTIHENDQPLYRELGKLWRESLGIGKEMTGASEPGTFSDWMYYHRGIMSLAARPWTPAVQVELAKEKQKPTEKNGQKGDTRDVKSGETNQVSQVGGAAEKKPGGEDKRNEEDRAFLRWLDTNSPGSFVEWKPVEHPDFPGKKLEVGGFAPFSRSNPPRELISELLSKQLSFLSRLPERLPRVGIRATTVKDLGAGVFDITVKVENTGYLPTVLAHGVVTREVLPTLVILAVDEKDLLSGQPRTFLDPIPGSGGMREARFVLYARGRTEVEVHVISALGGGTTAKVQLKESQ